MSIEVPLGRVESLLDYLINAEVVNNTFGTIGEIHHALDRIDAWLTADLAPGARDRLRRVLTTIEDNRSLFAIPEKYLIDNVYRSAGRLRKKVGA